MMCGAELSKLPDGVQRVVAFLQSADCTSQPRILEDAARTAQQAADALGVELGQIAKSIVFRRKSDDAAVLVITSGDKRVDETKVERLVCEAGSKMGRADADFVKLKTGFAIGGVAPVAHLTKPVTLLDKELFRFKSVWAAAGHPNAVFEVSPAVLQALVASVAEDVTL